jgi:hypothetical protein
MQINIIAAKASSLSFAVNAKPGFNDTSPIGSFLPPIISGTPGTAFTNLQTMLPKAFAATQDHPLVPQIAYSGGTNSLTGQVFPTGAYPGWATSDTYAQSFMNTLNITGTAQAVARIRTVAPGNNYTQAPNVVIVGGGPTCVLPSATAGLNPMGGVTLLTAGTGYQATPTVTFGAPLAAGAGVIAVQATGEVTISGGTVNAINVVEPGANYDVTAAAVAPTCTITAAPGDPGTGATCQVQVGAANTVGSIVINTPGSGCTQEPLVFLTNKPGVYGLGATAIAQLNGSLVFTTKSMTEGFDPDYGRMDIRLGSTPNPLTPSVGSGMVVGIERYIDPPNEIVHNGETTLWRVTHLGVDSHALHFHLFDLQIVNRIDFTNVLKPPYPDELGWRETIRTNPMEDIIVALKPQMMVLPFPLPQSVRPLDPSTPVGSTTNFFPIAPPAGIPAVAQLVNDSTNFGYEYVWHCHLLGHEENDMMRPLVMNLAAVPTVSAPSIAWNPTIGKFHVAISRADNRIYLGTANVDGIVNDDFVALPTGTTTVGPAIAWDTTHNKLIIMVKSAINTNLQISNMNADGTASSGWTRITATSTGSPAIAWNPTTGRLQYAFLGPGNTISVGAVNFDGTNPVQAALSSTPGVTVGSDPAIAIATTGTFAGRVQLAARATTPANRIVVSNAIVDGTGAVTTFSGWKLISTGTTTVAPAIAWNSNSAPNGKLDVVVKSAVNTRVQKNSVLGDSTGLTGTWAIVTGALSSDRPAAGFDPLLTPLIIVTDNGGSLTGYSTPGL